MAAIFEKNKPPQDILEIDRLAEAELSRFQRQFRIMEGDRVAFAEETGGKLKKVKGVIQNLKNEKLNILTDLKVAESEKNKRNDQLITAKLNELLGEQNKYIADIKETTRHISEIDYQIKTIGNQIKIYEQGAITDYKCQEHVLHAKSMVMRLENKLDVAIKKFNSILAENDRLREEIDHLIKERAHFNLLWQTMVGNLSRGKKFMMDLVEQATLAYDQREEWCNKLQALKDRGRSDLMFHTQEMRELQRTLDHDAKLQDFLGVKGQKRIMADLERREAAKRQRIREKMELQLEKYRVIFDQIKDFSGEENIERLASQFIKQEEENFALFNYVNELNYELETLNDSVDDLRKKIDAQRELNDTRAKQQKDRLEQMEEELTMETNKSDETEKHLQTCDLKLKDTLKGIETIFKLVKCNNAPILDLLGDSNIVSIYNAHLYLGILEKRTNELINMVYYKDKTVTPSKGKAPAKGKESSKPIIREPPCEKPRLMALNKIVKTQPCPLCVELEQVSDVVETLQEPLLRPEVQEKLDIRLTLPDALDRMHNVSACHLPASRVILQKRYQ